MIRGRKPTPKTSISPIEAPEMASDWPVEVQQAYATITASLEALGVIHEADLPSVELMAAHYAIAKSAAKEILTEGLTAHDKNGSERKSPMLQVLRDHSEAYKSYAAEFGMTPAARERITLNQQDEENPFERFLAEKDIP